MQGGFSITLSPFSPISVSALSDINKNIIAAEEIPYFHKAGVSILLPHEYIKTSALIGEQHNTAGSSILVIIPVFQTYAAIATAVESLQNCVKDSIRLH